MCGGWVGEQIEDAVDFVVEDVGGAVVDVVEDVGGVVVDAVDDVVDFTEDTIDFVWEDTGIGDIVEKQFDVIEETAEGIWEVVETVGEKGLELTKDGVDQFIDYVKDPGDLFDDVKEVASNPIKWTTERVDAAYDFVKDEVVGELGSIFEDHVKGNVEVLDDMIENPYVRTAISIAYPPVAPYLNTYAKVDSGEPLTATDLATIGLSAYGDFNGFEVPAEVQQGFEFGAKLADGQDIQDAALSTYGTDWISTLELDETISGEITDIFGQEAGQAVYENLDLTQAAADILTDTSTERFIANQFGDELVRSLGASTDNSYAFGMAAVEAAVGKEEGLSTEDILKNSAQTYKEEGGGVPDVKGLADNLNLDFGLDFDFAGLGEGYDFSGFDFSGIDLSAFKNLDLPDLPNFNLGVGDFNWEGVELGDYDLFELADLGVNIPSLDLSGINIPDFDLGELANLGVNLPDLNWEGIKVGDIRGIELPDLPNYGIDLPSLDWSGYDLTNSEYSLPELQDMGVDFGDLNIGGVDLPKLALASMAASSHVPTGYTPTPVKKANWWDNELSLPTIESDLTNELLQKGRI
jgi:hypothetical protein